MSLELLAEYRVASAARDAADRGLAEHLSSTAQALERAVSDAVSDLHGGITDLHIGVHRDGAVRPRMPARRL